MTKLNLDWKIKDVLEKYPETFHVFTANGFVAKTKEELINDLGDILMLKTVLKVKGINTELFIKVLEEKIKERADLIPEAVEVNMYIEVKAFYEIFYHRILTQEEVEVLLQNTGVN